MKNKTSLFLCLSLLLGLCGCNSVTPIPVRESSIDEVNSSSTISSEERVPSITLSQHEVSLITDNSVTVSFKTKNYRGNVEVVNSNSDVCEARVEKKDLIIDGLQEGTAVITLVAGEATDQITVTVEQRVVSFRQHVYSSHARNGIWCPFETNAQYNNIDISIIDIDVQNPQISAYVEPSQKAIYVECHTVCTFKLKISSRNAYDLASFNFYVTPWPEAARQYDEKKLVIRDENYNLPHVCATLIPHFDEQFFEIDCERGMNGTFGSVVQYNEINGIYYFGKPAFDLNIDSLPEKGVFVAINLETMEIWSDFNMEDTPDALYGPNFEPYHLTTFTPVEDIIFTIDREYHVGETVTFVSRPSNEEADFYPYYQFMGLTVDEASYIEKLDIFNTSVIFHKTGVYRVQVSDELTGRCVEKLITIVE